MAAEIAWLDDGARRFVARVESPVSTADSAVVRLIQGIWELEPHHARRILRHRIFTTADHPTEMCLGMMKVAAKRMEAGVSYEELSQTDEKRLIELQTLAPLPSVSFAPGVFPERSHEDWMKVALALLPQTPASGQRYLNDRRVAAILVSCDGKLLGAALNANAKNRTRHAEVNLVQEYCARSPGGQLPRGVRLYTTLKSCKMCAGMIWSAALDPTSLQIFYSEEDRGPMARLTVFTPGSHERCRVAAENPTWLDAQVEHRVCY